MRILSSFLYVLSRWECQGRSERMERKWLKALLSKVVGFSESALSAGKMSVSLWTPSSVLILWTYGVAGFSKSVILNNTNMGGDGIDLYLTADYVHSILLSNLHSTWASTGRLLPTQPPPKTVNLSSYSLSMTLNISQSMSSSKRVRHGNHTRVGNHNHSASMTVSFTISYCPMSRSDGAESLTMINGTKLDPVHGTLLGNKCIHILVERFHYLHITVYMVPMDIHQ